MEVQENKSFEETTAKLGMSTKNESVGDSPLDHEQIASEVTQMIQIILSNPKDEENLVGDRIKVMAALYKLNRVILQLPFPPARRLMSLLSRNVPLLDRCLDLVVETPEEEEKSSANPLQTVPQDDMSSNSWIFTCQVLELMNNLAMDSHSRHYWLKEGCIDVLFSLLKLSHFPIQEKIFHFLDSLLINPDGKEGEDEHQQSLHELADDLSNKKKIEILFRWLRFGNEQVQLLASKLLGLVANNKKGSQYLEMVRKELT